MNPVRARARGLILVIAAIGLLLPLRGSADFDDGELLLGLIPEENIFRQVKRYKPLEAYLSEALGMKVRFTVLSRYPDIIDRFVSRKMDGAFFGIFTAALARENLDIHVLARPVGLDGTTTAQGCLFVRSGHGIKGIADMRGRDIAFVDMATATGYLYALAYFREHGVHNWKSYFGKAHFTGSHETAVYTVLSGQADIGVAKCRVIEKLGETDPLIVEELKIIARSVPLPDNTLCVRRGLPEHFNRLFLQTLLDMHNNADGREVLKGLEATSFAPASWNEFAPVIDLVNKAGLNLKDYRYK